MPTVQDAPATQTPAVTATTPAGEATPPRDESGRFVAKTDPAPARDDAEATDSPVIVDRGDKKPAAKAGEPATPAKPTDAQAQQQADQKAQERQDQKDADAFEMSQGRMSQADFEAKWNTPTPTTDAPAEDAEPGAEKDATEAAAEAKPDAEAERLARLDALDILRKDFGREYTKDTLAKLPLETLKGMVAERKTRQDKTTQTIEKLKAEIARLTAGGAATLRQPASETTDDAEDGSPNHGASKQRTPTASATDPLDDLDDLSVLDPEAATKAKAAITKERQRAEQAQQRAADQAEQNNQLRFQVAMLRATEAHPELKNEGVRKALLSAMEARDPKMAALTSGDDDELADLIESCAERVIPPKSSQQPKKPTGAPDLATRRSVNRAMTQDDKDELAYEAVQKFGTNQAAVDKYIAERTAKA